MHKRLRSSWRALSATRLLGLAVAMPNGPLGRRRGRRTRSTRRVSIIWGQRLARPVGRNRTEVRETGQALLSFSLHALKVRGRRPISPYSSSMPEWGLTKATRATEPFGIDAWWLEPGKVITDPVHGDIFITRLEQTVLDTPPMQRLRRVRQLGTTHLVYPGATHTRFSHSLGAVRVVQTLLDVVIGQRDRPHAIADLFDDWEREEKGVDALARPNPSKPSDPPADLEFADDESWREGFRRRWAEATVLARLGALLHDLGHLPFGHTIEDDLRLLPAHDENAGRFEVFWIEIISDAKRRAKRRFDNERLGRADRQKRMDTFHALTPEGALYKRLRPLILAKEKDDRGDTISAVEAIADYPFVADMVGNTICADLLDYLERDHTFTGLPLSLGTRYLSSFYITPGEPKGALYRRRMALLIHRNGRTRQDVVTEILKHLRYRYELQERALVHHTKLAADAMVGKMIELWAGGMRKELEMASLDELKEEGAEIPAPTRRSITNGLEGDLSELDRRRQTLLGWRVESLFTHHGDDGIIEHVAGLAGDQQPVLRAAATVAQGLRDRDLYRLAANSAGASAAEDLYATFGGAEERRRLEELAAKHAEIGDSWQVILWIPGPGMRLKLAELLVDNGSGISKFKDQSRLGSDIYDAHRNLWKISVFVGPTVGPSQARAALAKLSELMGVSWDAERLMLGDTPATSPEHLATVEALQRDFLDEQAAHVVAQLAEAQAAARGGEATHSGLVSSAKALVKQHRQAQSSKRRRRR